MNRFIWWHRIKGHDIETRMALLGPMDHVHCIDCDLHWTKSWL